MIRIFALFFTIFAQSAQAETVKLAVTTSFHNSGLSDVLVPEIKSLTGVTVQLLVVGTGQALRLGEAGDVDAILVHSKAAEEAFVAAGYGTHRREIMFNDFVIIGPKDDPAAVKDSPNAASAFRKISASRASFVSRGDDSGTHKRELSLWETAGLTPEDHGRWYKEVGAGMGASLNTASGLNSYILADRASWLNFENKGDLAILVAGDPALFNQYAFIPVSGERHPHVKSGTVIVLENWLASDAAKILIDGYTIKGEALFTFNATPLEAVPSDK